MIIKRCHLDFPLKKYFLFFKINFGMILRYPFCRWRCKKNWMERDASCHVVLFCTNRSYEGSLGIPESGERVERDIISFFLPFWRSGYRDICRITGSSDSGTAFTVAPFQSTNGGEKEGGYYLPFATTYMRSRDTFEGYIAPLHLSLVDVPRGRCRRA